MAAAEGACDVLVIGHDPAALLAALDCARIGLSVEVWIPDLTPDNEMPEGTAVDSAVAPAVFTHRGGIVAELLDGLGVDYRIEKPVSGEENLAGIPASPLSPYVRRELGSRSAWRVYFDRIKPVLTIGNEDNLVQLVRTRIGQKALEVLVNPALEELYGYSAGELTVDAVAPGLAQAMTRGGSLTTGVLEMMMADERVVQRVVVPGGTSAIVSALEAKLDYFAATIVHVCEPELELVREDGKPGFHARAEIAGDLIMDLDCGAVLVDPDVVAVPDDADLDRVGLVGYTAITPGLESAGKASIAAAIHVRRTILSDPENPPIGPSGFEG